jgi:hypothetical protein
MAISHNRRVDGVVCATVQLKEEYHAFGSRLFRDPPPPPTLLYREKTDQGRGKGSAIADWLKWSHSRDFLLVFFLQRVSKL